MNSEVKNIILTSVIVPILLALVPFIINYLNKLAEEVKARMKDKAFEKYVNIAEDAIETAVLAIMQTYVDSIKDNPEKWDKEAQVYAFSQAKLKALIVMGTATREALSEVYTDFDAWVINKIEEYVRINKVPNVVYVEKIA